MGKTEENLKQAFGGECEASIRYMAFADKAEADGYPGAARLFRAASKAEMVHALSHFKASGRSRKPRIILKRPSMVKPLNSNRCTRP